MKSLPLESHDYDDDDVEGDVEDQICWDHSGSILSNRAETSREVNADANIERFQQIVILARRKPILNMGDFRVPQSFAIQLFVLWQVYQ